ncbi:hypothetical protein N7539_003278 [Penicillium diatomitis]|uniref:F-box domain-containing protein n=1 Tax=Penicillium diatomitis TaxID=2819901 RepID=A0A9X0BZI5_9EURO|nr:uncharacterized protein N7539_003278 [Penicillium diatomitis]KAJ5491711.1 hypothetical protein N7539_003278 [Penicillium diatomitis]
MSISERSGETEQSFTQDSNPTVGLMSLPPELQIAVFQSLDSLEDIACLSGTCKQLHGVLNAHIPLICETVAARTLPCYNEMRAVVAEQGLLATDHPITEMSLIAHFASMSHNMDKLITYYHTFWVNNSHNDPRISQQLSPTEQTRFIKAHYQLWAMMLVSQDQRAQKISELDLEQSILLSDFLCIFSPEIINDAAVQKLVRQVPRFGRVLQRAIRGHRNRQFALQLGVEYHPISWTPYQPPYRFAWWCDKQQDLLHRMLSGALFEQGGSAHHPIEIIDDLEDAQEW